MRMEHQAPRCPACPINGGGSPYVTQCKDTTPAGPFCPVRPGFSWPPGAGREIGGLPSMPDLTHGSSSYHA
jgi:hypothetical protein